MPNRAADYNDFCRRWKITSRGVTPWPSRIDQNAMFAIVRKAGEYQLIRLKGVTGASAAMPLTKVTSGAFGQGHEGDRLEGALTVTVNGHLYVFTLNDLGNDEFEISLSENDAPLHVGIHGGPHGVDH